MSTGAWRRSAADRAGFSPNRDIRPWCRRSRAAARCCCGPTAWPVRPPPSRGSTKAGSAASISIARFEVEQRVEDQRAEDEHEQRSNDALEREDVSNHQPTPAPFMSMSLSQNRCLPRIECRAGFLRHTCSDQLLIPAWPATMSSPYGTIPMRTFAKMYFRYSEMSSLAVVPCHHGSRAMLVG